MTATATRARTFGNAAALLPPRADRPGWIRLLAIVAALAALATAIVVAVGAHRVHAGTTLLGQRIAPGVAATEDLSFALADMDAQLANVLLAGGDSGLTRVRADALNTYDQRRTQADADLRQAAALAGADPDAQRILDTVLDQFGRYEALAANVMLLSANGHDPAGRPAPPVLDLYRQATDLMATILPTAHRLTESNDHVLGDAYAAARGDARTALIWLAVLGIGLLAALAGLQIMLRLTVRRRLNPPLLVATALALGLILGGAVTNSAADGQLRVAKQDAFDSLIALQQARAIGYDANADESRYLLDPDRAAQYTQAFLTKSQELADLKATTLPTYYPALDRAIATDSGIGGLFGDELRNITFAGEGDAARRTLTAFATYEHDDRAMRSISDLRQAISLDTGGSNSDFAAYNKELDAVIAINQRGFDDAIRAGGSVLTGWTGWIPFGLTALIAAGVLLGVRPRLAEYR
ncbi:hypothetical protein [Nocardia sp. NPDC051570]|uniref:hypothetical protein n=1 Tax=Nocardia sp. NPDC051570 TaxID=3364324 RepID=UPI0037B852B8